jgi:hypothetical protein
MTVRSVCISAVALIVLGAAVAQTSAPDITFGQVYGSAGFLSPDPSGTMMEAPNLVLAFTAADGHRSLVLTQQTGDYIALLERGRYCISAYTRTGTGLQLAKNQLKCVTVDPGKDLRLDVMVVHNRK